MTSTLSQSLIDEIVAWLRANDVDPNRLPPDAHASLVDGVLTTDEWAYVNGHRQFIGNEAVRITASYPIAFPPPPNVAEWLRPRCLSCGR